jgi:formylglycine-generating enzyme required for sulfatase activity
MSFEWIGRMTRSMSLQGGVANRNCLTPFAVACVFSLILWPTASRSEDATPADFKPYSEKIPGTDVVFEMVPIPGGKFMMGSPEDEEGRAEDEGPQIEVEIKPFWMEVHEVTWEEFDVFAFSYDIKAAKAAELKGEPLKRTPEDLAADAVTRPTPPDLYLAFGYGQD